MLMSREAPESLVVHPVGSLQDKDHVDHLPHWHQILPGYLCNSKWTSSLSESLQTSSFDVETTGQLELTPQHVVFQVQTFIKADISCAFEIISLAFGHDHDYMDAIFPAHDTLEGRRAGSERILQIFYGDPHGHFMKVVDIDTGCVAGAAKWNIYEGGKAPPQPATEGGYWKSKGDIQFAEVLLHKFFALRQRC